MFSKNTVSVMRGAALWAATFASVVTVATIWSAAYVSFSTTDYAYPRTGGATNLNATMWNKLVDNVADVGARTSAITSSSGGSVGIGTSNPQAQLEIVGTSVRQTNYASNGNFTVARANGTQGSPSAVSAFERVGGLFFAGYDGSGFANVAAIAGYASQELTASGHGSIIGFETTASGAASRSERMRIDQNGYVGIGTANPAFKLDVNGTANVTGFRMPTGAGVGKVLTSDASGLATWDTGGGISSFESAELAANVWTVAVAHGLWGMPKWWSASLRCKTSEMGYTVGEEVDVTTSGFYNWYHYFTSADATNVTSMVGGTFYVGNKSAGSISGITPANWRLVLRAWK